MLNFFSLMSLILPLLKVLQLSHHPCLTHMVYKAENLSHHLPYPSILFPTSSRHLSTPEVKQHKYPLNNKRFQVTH